jgi:hypothetical protein
MQMRERIKAFSEGDARAFCTRLWFELTIVGRIIWSDESLDDATKLNALKWLNEIQHRVWGAYASDKADALERMLDLTIAHCESAPVLGPHVRVALDRSVAAAPGGNE